MPGKFTVTLDGKLIGRRQSTARTYTHAVIALEEDAELARRDANVRLAQATRDRDTLTAGLADLRWSGWYRGSGIPRDAHHAYVATLVLPRRLEVNRVPEVRCNEAGIHRGLVDVNGKYEDKLVPVKDALEAETRRLVANLDEEILGLRNRLGAIAAGEFKPAKARVLAWASRIDLAVKAAGPWRSTLPTHVVKVVPVDGVQIPNARGPMGKEQAARLEREAEATKLGAEVNAALARVRAALYRGEAADPEDAVVARGSMEALLELAGLD